MAWNYPNKYHSRKAVYDGMSFDSQKELQRWLELRMLEKAGEITGLRRQVRYLLIPEQREPDTTGPKGGVRKGKILERAVYYVADFVYKEKEAEGTVVEDAKGIRTKDYILKRKLMLWVYGIRIKET